MPSKLPYRIFSVSSQDSKCLASDLAYNSNSETPVDPHWESQRYCIYPQEIIFQFNTTVKIQQIKIISHPFKIPSRIDVSSCLQNDQNKSPVYTHLGHFSFGENSENDFKTVEEKTIYVETVCKLFKIIIKSFHKNNHNIFGQVGLINVLFVGDPSTFTDIKEAEANTFVNLDIKETALQPQNEESKSVDSILKEKISALQQEKLKAITSDNFDEAKILKEEIDGLNRIVEKANELEQKKKDAILKEEYDNAKIYKAELEQLRQSIATTPQIPQKFDTPPKKDPIKVEEEKTTDEQPQAVPITTPPKIIKETKKIINVDSIILPGANAKQIDYKSVTEDDVAKPILEVEDIPEDKKAYAQTLIEIIGEDTTKRYLSKKWQNREAAMNLIISKMSDILLKGESALNIIIGMVKECIADKLSYISIPAMSLYLKVNEEMVAKKMQSKPDLQALEIINAFILDYVSDPNNKVKKKAIATYVSLSVTGSNDFNYWVTFMFKKASTINPKIANTSKNLEGRLETLRKMFEKSEFLTKKIAALVSPNAMKSLIQYIVSGINNPTKGLRDVASDMLVEIYNAFGYKKIEGDVGTINRNSMVSLAKSIPELNAIIEKEKAKPTKPKEASQDITESPPE